MSSLDTKDLKNTCRTCLSKTTDMKDIFKSESSISLIEMLIDVTSVQIVENDGLPLNICNNCYSRATDFYNFKQQCIKSDIILRELVNGTETLQEYLEEATEPQSPLSERSNSEIEKTELSEWCRQDVESNLEFLRESELNDSNSIPENFSKILGTENKTKGNSKATSISNSSYKLRHIFIFNANGDKVYPCHVCKREYKHTNSLTVHMRSHTGLRPFLCTLCGKGFKQVAALSCHMRSHTQEKPYQCNICDKQYRQSASLKAHMRIHTGQRPYLCSVCGKGFRQAPDLGYHMRTHTKEKPYMCNVCGKRMSMSCHLVQHMRTHTGEKPFICEECGKRFASTTRLKRHEIIHTGLKPYACDVCEKSFNRASTLRVHAMIHTDERPHVCPVCGKGFIQAHCLRSHVNTHKKHDIPKLNPKIHNVT